MGYPLRFQEFDWELFEVTFRCAQARLLFRPGDELNRRFIGCLGQALDVSEGRVRAHYGANESNHAHLVISALTAADKADFKRHLRTNLSKEIGLLHDWKEGIFRRRTKDIPIREDNLEERLMYLAAHGVKSNLVETPRCWPGVQFVRAVTEGVPLKGVWYNRTKFYRAMQNWLRRKTPSPRPKLQDFAEERVVELAPIPGFDEGLPEAERRAKWCQLMEDAVKVYPPKLPVLGPENVKKADPHSAPAKPKRSPAPLIHTKDPKVRAAWLEKYRAACEGYGARVREIMEGKQSLADFPRELVAPPWLRPPKACASG